MDECRWCGGLLNDCNETEVVCPWCGEADCWPRLDYLVDFDLDHFDPDFDRDSGTITNEEDTS